MKLYDSIFEEVRNVLKGEEPRIFPYEANKTWPQHGEYEILLQSDMAYELGNGRKHSANMTCITDNADLVKEDGVYLYGPDLQEITGSTDYVRMSQILFQGDVQTDAETDDAEKLHRIIQDIDFVKYHVYTKGFMMRTSGQSVREQVRVGRQAVRDGISFSAIGNTMIAHYKRNPYVAKARVVFFTAKALDYGVLEAQARHAMDIKNSLSMLQKGLPTECTSCSIKELCGEMEGLRELHFGRKKNEKNKKNRIILGK